MYGITTVNKRDFSEQVTAAEITLYHISKSILKNDCDCADPHKDVAAPEGIELSDTNLFEGMSVSIDGNPRANYSSGFWTEMEQTENCSIMAENQNITNERYYEIWIFNNEQVDLTGRKIIQPQNSDWVSAFSVSPYRLPRGSITVPVVDNPLVTGPFYGRQR